MAVAVPLVLVVGGLAMAHVLGGVAPTTSPTTMASRSSAGAPTTSGTPSSSAASTSPSSGSSGSSVFGATGLDRKLATAFAQAAAAAKSRGVTVAIRSGWRSAAQQQLLYDAAIRRYGSVAKAQRWVLPPASSAHVQGLALDVKPRAGALWLEKNGYRYGLCRRYDNEWWHFELRTTPGKACPAREPYARP